MPAPRYILGLSFFYHDSAAVLLKDGELVAAAQEERFTRKKADDDFPVHAIRYCLSEAGIGAESLSAIAYYEKPFLHFERLLLSFIETWPRSLRPFLAAMPLWMRRKLWSENIIRKETGFSGDVLYVDHHLSHAASAFFPSGFEEAAVLTLDGVGEWATTTCGIGKGNDLTLRRQIIYPDSLGLFYSSLTHYLGFKPNSAEYKVMGLAPYGTPRYIDKLRSLIAIHDDGSYTLNRKVFGWHMSAWKTSRALTRLLGEPTRRPESPLSQFHKDVARSLQDVLEEAVVALAKRVRTETGMDRLCLAGGVALNCVANSRILREDIFTDVFIQPASGDAGGALGAALYVEHTVLKNARRFPMHHVFWGPSYADAAIEEALTDAGIHYRALGKEQLIKETAALLADNKVVGWFQGRMEYGPRSLGNRSILGDPRQKENWQRINLKIKFRESFRPFAPSVLLERSGDYFDLRVPSPFMLLTAQTRNDALPAVTHVDGSARLQTVAHAENPLYYELIKEFAALTGCPVLINTSFNVRSEPIVCTPLDAVHCFLATDIDYLAIGNCLIDKKDVPKEMLDRSIIDHYELD